MGYRPKLFFMLKIMNHYLLTFYLLLLSSLAPAYSVSAKSLDNAEANLENEIEANVKAGTSGDFDYTKLTGMDVFPRPDLMGQEYAAFNGLDRAGKMQVLEDMGVLDNTSTHDYLRREDVGWENKFECGEFSGQKDINFFGCENLENWSEKDKFDITQNGKYNLPVFSVATNITEGGSGETNTVTSGHWINGIFVGPEDSNVKADPKKFDQWVFFEPQAEGTYYVQPGDFGMNKDGKADIYWFGHSPDAMGNWKHYDTKLIEFRLKNSLADETKTRTTSYLLTENPHTTTVKLSQLEDKLIERGANAPDLSSEAMGIPTVSTNLEDYEAMMKHEDGEKTYLIDSDHPEYFTFTRQFTADVEMGRWSAENAKNLADTIRQDIRVGDTTSPVVTAPADITIGYNTSTGTEITGEATGTDDSPYTLDSWYEDNIISQDANYKVIERTHFKEDISENLGSDKQKITVDLNTGMNEAKAQGGFDIEPQYSSRGVNLKTFASERGDVALKVFNLNGQLVKQEHFGISQGMQKDVWMNENFTPGTYLIKASLKTASNILILKR